MPSASHELSPTVTLPNGVEIPRLGFGVYQIPDANQCTQAVEDAIDAGYRLIDTAASYYNEQAVGRGIAHALERGAATRDELFVATKVWVQDAGYAATMGAFETSLAKLGLDYLDLYLIHQPLSDYYGSWRALEELYRAGRIRAIGVCNFGEERLADLCLGSRIAPMIDQVEIHPFCQRAGLLATMREFGVQAQAWGPFAEGRHGLFENPVLTEIGAAHGKSTAQVALRWNLQLGNVVLAKSTHAERMRENAAIWDFSLSEDERARIAALDTGNSAFIGHASVESVRMRYGVKVHE